jgi:type IV pilus assembly protein PilW
MRAEVHHMPVNDPQGKGYRAECSAGFSLVEMMVAITVSLILMAGVIQLMVGNKQAYRLQEGASRLNENARFAIADISHKLRMGGHWGGVPASNVDVEPTATVSNNCTQAGWTALSNAGIGGYEGAASSPMQSCIPNANYLPNSDVVLVRYASADPDTTAEATGASSSNIYLRVSVGRRGEILAGGDITSLPSDLYDASDPDADGVFNYPYRIFAYFVRPCSAPGTDKVCNTADDVGDGIPTLVRLALNGDELDEEDVVEGVEQMQVLYGVNTDGDLEGNADRYFTADNVPNWDNVVSVRLSLLVRNPEIDVAANDTNAYQMAGGFNYTPPVSDRQYTRKLFNNVIQIRNRTRS